MMRKNEQGSAPLWIIIGLLVTFMVASVVYGKTRPGIDSPHTTGGAWNANMVMGNKDAPNKFIQYSDYFCSFCESVHEAVADKDFKTRYIDSGKISHEIRIVTMLSSVSPNTEQGAEAAYCAADQKKFREYSNSIIPRIKKEFFDKGIGVKNVANPVPIAKLPLEYFTESAREVGMDTEEFSSCMTNETHKKEIADNTNRAIRVGVTGLPALVVNDYVSSSGFAGGYPALKTVLKAGGVE